MCKGNVIFIRFKDEEIGTKKKLEKIAHYNAMSMNEFLRKVLVKLANTETCDNCPIGSIRDAYKQDEASPLPDPIRKSSSAKKGKRKS
jgi:hypothetical protein